MFSFLCNCSFPAQLTTDDKVFWCTLYFEAFMWIANISLFCREKKHHDRKSKETKRWECFHLSVFGIQAR